MADKSPDALLAAVQSCLLGFAPGGTTQAIGQKVTLADGHVVEDLRLEGQPPIPATLVRPDGPGPFPAVLYVHAQNDDPGLGRRELLQGSAYLQGAYGPALAAMGVASLAIDLTGCGDRRGEGTWEATATSLSWWGQSLFSYLLDDLSDALGYLIARPDIDRRRVFSLGMSLGGALGFWLAALDRRLAGTAHLCILSDGLPLIGAGQHRRLAPAYVVPGLLRVAEIGAVAGLVAPRPQLVCLGEADPLTPEAARRPALGRLRAAYAAAGAEEALQVYLDPEAGHVESAAMRVRVLDFLDRASPLPLGR